MNPTTYDAIIVGAGFAGMYTTIHARRRGLKVLGIEAAPEVGGTWYWNRYPGARCDVESIDYSYSFDAELEAEWRWSERYATQPEILRYLQHVADRFDVRRSYRFEERVERAEWDDAASVWNLVTSTGAREQARWLIMATGPLSAPVLPNISGRESFAGLTLQTSAWPHEDPDLHGLRVGVIGTGSSGIQAIPEIAREAASVHVFQRTPNYSVPAFNRFIDDEEWEKQQLGLSARRAKSWAGAAGSPWESHPVPFEEVPVQEREAIFAEAWQRGGVLFAKAFQRQTIDPVINEAAKRFFLARLAEKVHDPATREALTPKNQALGVKRICTDSGYYETFNEPHVTLVDLQQNPITRITPTSIITHDGEVELDCIVYATGFDAMTGALTQIDIVGRNGILLRDDWSDGYRALLGVGIPGFPNLLALNGPGSPSVFANLALTSEQQGAFALDLIEHTAAHGYTACEARADAADAWVSHTQAVADATLFGASDSWYTGANLDGKSRTFLPYPGGFAAYNAKAADIANRDYAGFLFTERNA